MDVYTTNVDNFFRINIGNEEATCTGLLTLKNGIILATYNKPKRVRNILDKIQCNLGLQEKPELITNLYKDLPDGFIDILSFDAVCSVNRWRQEAKEKKVDTAIVEEIYKAAFLTR